MNLINPEDLPEDGQMIIVGSDSPTHSDEAQKECFSCHFPCFISSKNANRNAKFMCKTCALTDPAFLSRDDIATTTADMASFLQYIGVPVNDRTIKLTAEWMKLRLKEEIEKRKNETGGHDA